MLIIETYARMWPMIIGIVALVIAIMGLIWRVRIPRFERPIRPNRVLWSCLIAWLILASVCLTLIDEPYFNVSKEVKNWMFMFSAFLGIPLTMPLLAGMVWAWGCRLRNESVALGALVLVMLAAFWLGCAASNVHDIVWCGVITDGLRKHYGAGSDIAFFYVPATWLGIPKSVAADYAALGPFAIIFVAGELAIVATAFARLNRSYTSASMTAGKS
jgi:small basic protein